MRRGLETFRCHGAYSSRLFLQCMQTLIFLHVSSVWIDIVSRKKKGDIDIRNVLCSTLFACVHVGRAESTASYRSPNHHAPAVGGPMQHDIITFLLQSHGEEGSSNCACCSELRGAERRMGMMSTAKTHVRSKHKGRAVSSCRTWPHPCCAKQHPQIGQE